MPPPLAYFISWTTKGSWLHGDPRGWVIQGIPGIQEPDPHTYELARSAMSDNEVVLEPVQRQIVSQTIGDHCRIRGWTLHALNPRTNHVHVVVTASSVPPETVMEQFKSWCSRRLNERAGRKRKWWTEHGSTKWINDQTYFENAVKYVRDGQ
ncbi:MAG: transposase [Phycisphaerales bacterium]|nr:transposase [Phycisphaerales bacterium]